MAGKIVAAALLIASAWELPALGLDAAQQGASPEVLTVAASDNFPPVNMLDAAGQLSSFGREMSTAVLSFERLGESALAGYSAREVALLVVTAGIVAVLLGVLVTFVVANVRLRRAKRELGRSEERFRAMVENALDIMTIVDREGRVLLESPSVEHVLGYTPGERQGQDVFTAVHPDDEPRVRETLAFVLEQPDSVERVEFRVRAKDGTSKVMEALARNLMHTAGIEGILVTSRNIASRPAAERLELRIGRILEDSMNEIFVVDPETMRVIEVNREARQNLGYSAEELLQMTLFDFVVEPPPAEFEGSLRPLFRGEADRIVRSARHRRKDGTTYEVEARVSISRSEDPPVLIAVTADMTERLETDAQLRQAQKMEAVGRLAGGIAHDFNNLLQVILGHGELLLEHPDITPPVRIGLHHAVDAARRAADLTRQFLAFSRRQVLEPKVLDLNVVVDGIQSMVQRVIGDHIALAIRLEPDLGAALVDRGQIEQVILNLVVNACDAMPGGGKLTIETRNVFVGRTVTSKESPREAGPSVLLAVTDSGQGMTPEVRKHVFEPFFTTKELGKGTGLGLSTVLGIVEQSGGRIRVESEPGCGTRFEVYFPWVNGQIDEAAGELSGRAPSGTETLLLVEDDELVRETVRCMLEESGYRVHAASRPDEALRIADRLGGGIDLLLTDVVMPLMSGRDLAEELGSKLPSLRVLLMSGHTDNSIAAIPGDLPSGAFLQKPFTADELRRMIREVMEAER